MSTETEVCQCTQATSYQTVTADRENQPGMPMYFSTKDSAGRHYWSTEYGRCEHGKRFSKAREISQEQYATAYPDEDL